MTKKQANKKKVNVKINKGESIVIFNYETLLHIAETYDFLATQEEDIEGQRWYRDVADSIRYQSGINHFEDDIEYEEW